MQLPIKGVWPVQEASDLQLGDHVCEKSDAVNWIDCILFWTFKITDLF